MSEIQQTAQSAGGRSKVHIPTLLLVQVGLIRCYGNSCDSSKVCSRGPKASHTSCELVLGKQLCRNRSCHFLWKIAHRHLSYVMTQSYIVNSVLGQLFPLSPALTFFSLILLFYSPCFHLSSSKGFHHFPFPSL